MKAIRLTTGLLLALGAATTGLAQQTARAVPGYIGIRFEETVSRGPEGSSDRIIVREVSKDSPAEKAGLKADDEILRINDMLAGNGKFSAIARTLVAGDTVRLLIKRDGRERAFTVIAAARPAHLLARSRDFVFQPDSVRSLMLRYLDSARIHLDTLRLPNIYIRRDGDSAFAWHFGPNRMLTDSVLLGGDSAIMRIFSGRPGEGMLLPHGRMEIERDFGPSMIFRSMELGTRAVGGAELTEMEPALAEYFGGTAGILTLRVLPETPAARAGLQAGDVIVRADGEPVRSLPELRARVAAHPDGVKLDIRRKGQNRTIELKTRARK